ncbi:MAG: NusA-like transcription termination signal-binding factor [Candidatus Heimdallarchaeota archaeon]|nr:NusA-like transcription termination signal-binding factor [Candidatus Heimdallarchaeota archaeon]
MWIKLSASGIKLSVEQMKTMRIFEGVTKVSPLDCIIDKKLDRIIFLVKRGTVGMAIGRNGTNIKKLKSIFGKDVDIVENDEEPERLIKNALGPAKVLKVDVVDRKRKGKIAFVKVSRDERGLAIGKDGRNIERARVIAKRHFDIENVIIA